ncbi:hypothetical protein M758_10G071500 [Ceratodon purpureus]|nr:hypothetical protein M758_10G071500 [Ceratodon purpureus]
MSRKASAPPPTSSTLTWQNPPLLSTTPTQTSSISWDERPYHIPVERISASIVSLWQVKATRSAHIRKHSSPPSIILLRESR